MRQHRTFKVYNSKRENVAFNADPLSLLDIYGYWLVTAAASGLHRKRKFVRICFTQYLQYVCKEQVFFLYIQLPLFDRTDL